MFSAGESDFANADATGVSPTEREFDLATELGKPMQWAGCVEKAGTGTTDIIEKCVACGHRKPEVMKQLGGPEHARGCGGMACGENGIMRT